MDWLKKNYDLSLLGLGALALAVSAALFSLGHSGEATLPAPPPAPARPAPPAAPSALEQIPQATALLESTPKIGSTEPADPAGRGSPFVSRSYLLKEGKLFDPVEGGEDLHPPITNAWLNRHNLEISNLRIKDEDPDKDGFSNLEEFIGNTDPNDPKSTPPRFTKFKLVEFIPIPFLLEFKGDSGDGTLQINLKNIKGSARTQFKKIGDLVSAGEGKAPYKILSHTPKEATNDRGVLTNVSEIVLENTDTKETITLVYNVELDDPTSTGTFIDLVTQETQTLTKGKDFNLPLEGGTKFNVIDISESGAEILEVETGKKYPVFKQDSAAPISQ